MKGAESIVLAGGGAHGAYAVGVMEALFSGRWQQGRHGAVEASTFTGTSVGAYSAAVMAQHGAVGCLEAVRHLREIWLDRIAEVPHGLAVGGLRRRPNGVYRLRGSPRAYLSSSARSDSPLAVLLRELGHDSVIWGRSWLWRGLSVSFDGESLFRRSLRLADLHDVISSEPLHHLIAGTLSPGKLLDPRAPTLRVVTTDWSLGRPVIFTNRKRPAARRPAPEGDCERPLDASNTPLAILASASLPGLFPAVRIGDQHFVDGGVLLNTPLHPALADDVAVMHVISLDHGLEPIAIGRSPSLLESLERLMFAVPGASLQAGFEQARQINRVSAVVGSLERALAAAPQLPAEDRRRLEELVETFGGRPQVAVHRHFPTRSLGGAFSLLDFRLDKVIEMIEQGFKDAVRHDCRLNGCLLV